MLALFFAISSAAVPVTAASPPAAEAVAPAPYVVGTDTLASIRAKLGKPTSIQSNSDGSSVAVYITTSAHIKGASFIPIVGLFAGGAKGHYVVRSFTFDAKGVLASFSSTDAQADCHANLGGVGCR